jgi:hypothetical protein
MLRAEVVEKGRENQESLPERRDFAAVASAILCSAAIKAEKNLSLHL